MLRFYSLEDGISKTKYMNYARICKKCHRIAEMWSKTQGIGFEKCLCNSYLMRSDEGDSIYG